MHPLNMLIKNIIFLTCPALETLLQLSQASPTWSLSISSCNGSKSSGHLSSLLRTPSPSLSTSHRSPTPSQSVSIWSGSNTVLQASHLLPTPSPSLSRCAGLKTNMQLSYTEKQEASQVCQIVSSWHLTWSFLIPSLSESSSHALPILSLSKSSCPQLGTSGQLSWKQLIHFNMHVIWTRWTHCYY